MVEALGISFSWRLGSYRTSSAMTSTTLPQAFEEVSLRCRSSPNPLGGFDGRTNYPRLNSRIRNPRRTLGNSPRAFRTVAPNFKSRISNRMGEFTMVQLGAAMGNLNGTSEMRLRESAPFSGCLFRVLLSVEDPRISNRFDSIERLEATRSFVRSFVC